MLPGSSMRGSLRRRCQASTRSFQLLARGKVTTVRAEIGTSTPVWIAAGALVLAAQVDARSRQLLTWRPASSACAMHRRTHRRIFASPALFNPTSVKTSGHFALVNAIAVPVSRMAAPKSVPGRRPPRPPPHPRRGRSVRESSRKIKAMARPLKPVSRPADVWSNSRTSRSDAPAAARTPASSAAHDTASGTTNARSRRTDGKRDRAPASRQRVAPAAAPGRVRRPARRRPGPVPAGGADATGRSS